MLPGTLPGMAMTTADKSREARLRQAAKRQRCELHSSGRRDPRAWNYGLYWIELPDDRRPALLAPLAVRDGSNAVVWFTLGQAEEWLNSDKPALAVA